LYRQLVECLGRDVRAIRPDDRPADGVKEHLGEERRVAKRLEDWSFEQREDIDALARAILERQV
jgi:hypothetical protein